MYPFLRDITCYNDLVHFIELPLCVFRKSLFCFKVTFTVLGTARHLQSVARTKVSSFNDQNSLRHLPELLKSLVNNILFCSKNRYSFFS